MRRPTFDWPTLIANKDKEIARLEAVYHGNLERAGVDDRQEPRRARGRPHGAARATGERVSAAQDPDRHRRRARHGPVSPGIEHVITSNEAFHLTELPERILIAAAATSRSSSPASSTGSASDVTLVYRGDNILRGFDDDVRDPLRARDGEARHHGRSASRNVDAVEKRPRPAASSCRTDGDDRRRQGDVRDRPRPEHRRASASKPPASSSTERARSRSTSTRARRCRHIYAVGDVTDRINLTPVAIREGHAFAETVFGGRPTAVDHDNVPTAVFSQPEIGVGRPDRGRGARAVRQASTSTGDIPADEDDPLRARRAHADEARRRRRDRPGARLPHRRARRRRDDPDGSASR